MVYELVYKSAFTTYVVDFYDSVATAERDCERRYGNACVRFTPNERGVLSVFIYSDTYVTLELYPHEVKTLEAV